MLLMANWNTLERLAVNSELDPANCMNEVPGPHDEMWTAVVLYEETSLALSQVA